MLQTSFWEIFQSNPNVEVELSQPSIFDIVCYYYHKCLGIFSTRNQYYRPQFVWTPANVHVENV